VSWSTSLYLLPDRPEAPEPWRARLAALLPDGGWRVRFGDSCDVPRDLVEASAALGEAVFLFGGSGCDQFILAHARAGRVERRLSYDQESGWSEVEGEPQAWEATLFQPRILEEQLSYLEDDQRPAVEPKLRALFAERRLVAGSRMPPGSADLIYLRARELGCAAVARCRGLERFNTVQAKARPLAKPEAEGLLKKNGTMWWRLKLAAKTTLHLTHTPGAKMELGAFGPAEAPLATAAPKDGGPALDLEPGDVFLKLRHVDGPFDVAHFKLAAQA
jgi:hypothetical protein